MAEVTKVLRPGNKTPEFVTEYELAREDTLQSIRNRLDSTIAVTGKLFSTPYTEIPGIGTGSVYASGDAFGTKFTFDVPKTGVIETAIILDMDDEGKTVELWLFRRDFTVTTDNDAFAVTDVDLRALEVVISITNYANANVNQVGINNGLSLIYTAPEGLLYGQCVTRDTHNIAAGNIPYIALRLLSYE